MTVHIKSNIKNYTHTKYIKCRDKIVAGQRPKTAGLTTYMIIWENLSLACFWTYPTMLSYICSRGGCYSMWGQQQHKLLTRISWSMFWGYRAVHDQQISRPWLVYRLSEHHLGIKGPASLETCRSYRAVRTLCAN